MHSAPKAQTDSPTSQRSDGSSPAVVVRLRHRQIIEIACPYVQDRVAVRAPAKRSVADVCPSKGPLRDPHSLKRSRWHSRSSSQALTFGGIDDIGGSLPQPGPQRVLGLALALTSVISTSIGVMSVVVLGLALALTFATSKSIGVLSGILLKTMFYALFLLQKSTALKESKTII